MLEKSKPATASDGLIDYNNFTPLPMPPQTGLMFSCPNMAQRLKEKYFLISNGLGFDHRQSKNMHAKSAPYVLSPLASEYLADKYSIFKQNAVERT